MSNRISRRSMLAAGVVPLLAGETGAAEKADVFAGKVTALSGLLLKQGVKLDADAGPCWLALAADDGKVYPLVKDDGARMFYKDARLLDRPMRLAGRLVAGGLLQVLQVHSVRGGRIQEVYYWCEICSIKRFEKAICDCCGGPLELREDPLPR